MADDTFQFPDLKGRTVLITGTTRGIGRALLPGLLNQGLRVIALGRGLARLETIRAELGATEEHLQLVDCDLGNSEAVAAAGRSLRESGIAIDGILHNAAIDPREWFEKADDALWHQVMQVNLFSAVSLTRELLPALRFSDQGRIIFTGSVIFDLGGGCMSAYAASKGAVMGVTRSLAHELKGSNITVNCLIPGAVRVEKEVKGIDDLLLSWQSTPHRLEPSDLLAPLCLLLSRWSRGITGQAITVDGGIVHPLAAPDLQNEHHPRD